MDIFAICYKPFLRNARPDSTRGRQQKPCTGGGLKTRVPYLADILPGVGTQTSVSRSLTVSSMVWMRLSILWRESGRICWRLSKSMEISMSGMSWQQTTGQHLIFVGLWKKKFSFNLWIHVFYDFCIGHPATKVSCGQYLFGYELCCIDFFYFFFISNSHKQTNNYKTININI